ncbi:hypothetical protein D918_08831 [Trichuris suis]|nr:hypothetical protein D918_08831 [Trichuris suis]
MSLTAFVKAARPSLTCYHMTATPLALLRGTQVCIMHYGSASVKITQTVHATFCLLY